jgi:exodeoxyribonuclease X
MIAWTKEPALLPTCPIGKFRGQPWADVEMGFLCWMTRQADMAPDLKWNAQREIDRRSTTGDL